MEPTSTPSADGLADAPRLADRSRALLWAARVALTAIHSALPLSQVYATEVAAVETNLRVTADQWWALAGTLGYALAFAALSFAMASLILRRRRSFGG